MTSQDHVGDFHYVAGQLESKSKRRVLEMMREGNLEDIITERQKLK